MKLYLKFAVQVFFAGVAAVVAALVDDRFDAVEWIDVGIYVVAAISVLGAGELPAGVWSHMKAYVAAAGTVLVALITFTTDGVVTQSEWLQLALGVAATLGVAFVPGPKVVPATPPLVR